MWDMYEADANRAVIADWIELELFRSGRPFYTDSQLDRENETTSDPEQFEDARDPDAGEEEWREIDPEILDGGRQALRDAMWDEFTLRTEALAQAYPYELKALRNGGWRLDRRRADDPLLAYAHWMYITTLTMSGFKHRHIRKQHKDDPAHLALRQRLEKQFQHISALAASAFFGPNTAVYSFGWPRQNGSDFQESLKDLADAFGSGKVRKKVPANSKGHEKDGTVDLVVWRVFTAPSPADPLIYGQVASGNNWREKPVEAYLKSKFIKWFKHPLTVEWKGATFMPFVRHTDVSTPPDGYTMDQAIAEESRDLAVTYGHMFDRLKITELFGSGLGRPEHRHQCEDPADVLANAQQWVEDCFAYCDRAGVPPTS